MKYLCLIYVEEYKLHEMSKGVLEAFMDECGTCAEELTKSDHMIVGAQLQGVRSATTVRVRNDRLATTDGPFAETKEQLGGFCLIDARDFNEAIQVAAKMPPARLGCVEVRPIKEG